ncbi:hypothetical protein ElP_61610 [Tautonia plasticadhaerens]|uniref:Uncharacterized protein n=1 Tax=Tautonia plasticadhaerens TaxID=2527974 RepID=A0A518HBK3_9BACT|nr:hypothetical protein ElP_61610 [Tautonia plasticadhaerens]
MRAPRRPAASTPFEAPSRLRRARGRWRGDDRGGSGLPAGRPGAGPARPPGPGPAIAERRGPGRSGRATPPVGVAGLPGGCPARTGAEAGTRPVVLRLPPGLPCGDTVPPRVSFATPRLPEGRAPGRTGRAGTAVRVAGHPGWRGLPRLGRPAGDVRGEADVDGNRAGDRRDRGGRTVVPGGRVEDAETRIRRRSQVPRAGDDRPPRPGGDGGASGVASPVLISRRGGSPRPRNPGRWGGPARPDGRRGAAPACGGPCTSRR